MKNNPYANIPLEQQLRPDVAVLGPKIITKFPEGSATAEEHPLITVVTAVFKAIDSGRKEQLLQCLDSVQAQTGVNLEHLVIDGASPDGTVDLIREYRNKTFPVRLLSEPDAGIYDAMNRGLWLARGKYVIFLNSDDYYSNPSGLAESVKRLEESGADFSYAPVLVLDETTGKYVDSHQNCHPNVNAVFVEMPFCHQSMLIRRKSLLDINGFDLRYSSAADYDSVLRFIFTKHRACFVPEAFVTFRLGGFSFVYQDKSYQEVGQIFSRHYKKYLNFDISPEEGTKIYATKLCPLSLKLRQFAWAKHAFGSSVRFLQQQEDLLLLDDDLLRLKERLRLFKRCRNPFRIIPGLLKLLASFPACFCKFLLLYFRYRLSANRNDAGKKACDELLLSLQLKRKSSAKDSRRTDRKCLVVTACDFWCTTGVYMPEIWGGWTGKAFSVSLWIPEGDVHQPFSAQVFLGGYVFPDSPVRTVDVVVNGRKVDTFTVNNLMPMPYHFDIPADAVTSPNLVIDFIADKVFVPKDLGYNEDTRELGMSFQKIQLAQSGSSAAEKSPVSKIPQEIRIGFLNQFSKLWVGGITYFKNLFQAMETTESPRLRPFIFRSPDELADCLLPYVSIFPDPPPPADPERIPTASDYHVDLLSHMNGYQVSQGRDGIIWIADFQHLHLPEMFDEKEISFRNHSFHTLIEQNRIVCLSSYDAMEDFKKYAPEAVDKARCLHFVSIPEAGFDQFSDAEAAEIRRNRQLPERYFYVPNQFWKHKNHIVVLQAVALLKKAGCPVHIVFSGNTCDFRFPHYFEELETFCRQEQITDNVHFLGLVPLREVYFLMRDCLAIINPSRFEGWSSSVEEAKSIGKTIFLSNLNVHYEQMPPHGTYFPCNDPAWLADLLKRGWTELKPGPDLALEEQARRQLPLRIKQFGRDFQRIVLDVLENKNSCREALLAAPEVTVVIAVRNLLECNQEKQMLRTLASVSAQRGVSVELLVVDCCSTDGTPEFLRSHEEQYGFRLISGDDHGLYEARNHGTIQAKGRYVTYVDPGDGYVAKDFLKRSVAALDSAECDFSYVLADADEADCFVKMPFRFQSMLFRRKALYSVAVYNDTLHCAGEYDLILRLILSGKRGIRINCAGAVAAIGGAPQFDEGLFQQECGQIYSRLYGRSGYAMTPEEGRLLYQQKQLPEELQKLLLPFRTTAFGISRPEWKRDETVPERGAAPAVPVQEPYAEPVQVTKLQKIRDCSLALIFFPKQAFPPALSMAAHSFRKDHRSIFIQSCMTMVAARRKEAQFRPDSGKDSR